MQYLDLNFVVKFLFKSLPSLEVSFDVRVSRFETDDKHCCLNVIKWGRIPSEFCLCGEDKTTEHSVSKCPSTVQYLK